MPLISGKSRKAMSENIKTEMDAGKPQKQSIAIAYSVARKGKKPKKMMADGGETENNSGNTSGAYESSESIGKSQKEGDTSNTSTNSKSSTRHRDAAFASIRQAFKAEGGEIERKIDEPSADDITPEEMDMIRSYRQRKAEGGVISASSEKRPMPDNSYNDAHGISRNSSKKPLMDSDWTDTPTEEQATRPSPAKMSSPKSMGSDALAMRSRSMKDEESDLISSDAPGGYPSQPKSQYDEEYAKKSGTSVPDMSKQHNNGRSAYAKGGPIMEPKDTGMGMMERSDEADLQRSASPGKHGEQPSSKYDALDAAASHHKSIAEAIMARSKAMKEADMYGSDMMHTKNDADSYSDKGIINYAEGGEAMDTSKMSLAELIRHKKMMKDGGQVDLQANANEDLNEEDQLSFDAARKDTYYDLSQLDEQPMDSNEKGDKLEDADEDNKPMISKIRSKMKSRRS